MTPRILTRRAKLRVDNAGLLLSTSGHIEQEALAY